MKNKLIYKTAECFLSILSIISSFFCGCSLKCDKWMYKWKKISDKYFWAMQPPDIPYSAEMQKINEEVRAKFDAQREKENER